MGKVISAGAVSFIGLVDTVGHIIAHVGGLDALQHIQALELSRDCCKSAPEPSQSSQTQAKALHGAGASPNLP